MKKLILALIISLGIASSAFAKISVVENDNPAEEQLEKVSSDNIIDYLSRFEEAYVKTESGKSCYKNIKQVLSDEDSHNLLEFYSENSEYFNTLYNSVEEKHGHVEADLFYKDWIAVFSILNTYENRSDPDGTYFDSMFCYDVTGNKAIVGSIRGIKKAILDNP